MALFNPILGGEGFHYFPKITCPKVNVIPGQEFELAYYDSAAPRFNHYTTRASPAHIVVSKISTHFCQFRPKLIWSHQNWKAQSPPSTVEPQLISSDPQHPTTTFNGRTSTQFSSDPQTQLLPLTVEPKIISPDPQNPTSTFNSWTSSRAQTLKQAYAYLIS